MISFNFGPATEQEAIVFGACRPGSPFHEIDEDHVDQWTASMKERGIERLVCLQPQDSASLLIAQYGEAFGADRVAYEPVMDFQLMSAAEVRTVLDFLDEADKAKSPVVVHCDAGIGRTGRVLAAWLVYRRGLSVKEAVEAVGRCANRDPYEGFSSTEYGRVDSFLATVLAGQGEHL